MYDLSIDPDKWVDLGELKLEINKPYWFKKENGIIVMGVPYASKYLSGVAEAFITEKGFSIRTNTFHILKNSQVQEVSETVA